MRSLSLLAAILLAGASPVSAATLFSVSVFGTVTGTQSTVRCVAGSALGCTSLYPNGFEVTPYIGDFSFSLGTRPLEEGANTFTYGFEYGGGVYEGTIIRNGNILTGGPIRFYKTDRASCGNNPLGCSYYEASATSFSVTGGVPEPSTWLMMLVGFGAIGASLRRRSSANAKPVALKAIG